MSFFYSGLFELLTWLDEHVQPNLVSRYSSLQAALQRCAQPNLAGASFEDEKEALFEALESVPMLSLTEDQLTFLEYLGIASYLGSTGRTLLEDLLCRNVIDFATSADKIQEIVLSLQKALQSAKQIYSGSYEWRVFEDLVRRSRIGKTEPGAKLD